MTRIIGLRLGEKHISGLLDNRHNSKNFKIVMINFSRK